MRGVERSLTVVLTLGLITCGAFGTMLDGDAAADISGTVNFAEPGVWDADVEYAVYAPGNYPGTHADKATSYIYAYQVFNAGASTVTLSGLTVGLAPGSGAASPTDDDAYGALGGIAPQLSTLSGTTSVVWYITSAPAEHTTVLLFSSPNDYTFGPATVADGGEGDTQSLPTPIPEPATLSLLAVACLPLLRRRRR